MLKNVITLITICRCSISSCEMIFMYFVHFLNIRSLQERLLFDSSVSCSKLKLKPEKKITTISEVFGKWPPLMPTRLSDPSFLQLNYRYNIYFSLIPLSKKKSHIHHSETYTQKCVRKKIHCKVQFRLAVMPLYYTFGLEKVEQIILRSYVVIIIVTTNTKNVSRMIVVESTGNVCLRDQTFCPYFLSCDRFHTYFRSNFVLPLLCWCFYFIRCIVSFRKDRNSFMFNK